MEQFTQKILTSALVSTIKAVAIIGIAADVIGFYANRNAEKFSKTFSNIISNIKSGKPANANS